MTRDTANATPAKNVAPPTEREADAISEYVNRQEARLPVPGLKLVEKEDGAKSLDIAHPDAYVGFQLLSNALGCASSDALISLLDQLVTVFTTGKDIDVKTINFAIKSIAALRPRDEIEAMLAIQMIATHTFSLRHLRAMEKADTIPKLEVYERTSNKLMRTFAAQMETLRKHRSGGRQHVEVRHVHVNEGGQAIIGAVAAGGGANAKK